MGAVAATVVLGMVTAVPAALAATGDSAADGSVAAAAGRAELVASPGGGATLWRARYRGDGGGANYATSVVVSPDGSAVFVAGGTTVAYDAFTGAVVWS